MTASNSKDTDQPIKVNEQLEQQMKVKKSFKKIMDRSTSAKNYKEMMDTKILINKIKQQL